MLEAHKAQLHKGTESLIDSSLAPFYHGVASGDPLPDAVIIWTRVSHAPGDIIEVNWDIATDSLFGTIVTSGRAQTGPQHDYTVKVDVRRLLPGTRYFYRFSYQGAISRIGQTRTAPAHDDSNQVQFAVVSCANYEWGYFNAYRHIAERNDIDAVIHLGDYIYEYGPGGYGDKDFERTVVPDHEIVTLSDYRTRYAQYRLDPDLRQVHESHAFIAVWDDHEITNNAHVAGAENHQPDQEGDYEERKRIARQVYFEWLPIREMPDQEIYRSIRFGKTAQLVMLDERLAGRSPQAPSVTHEAYTDSSRTMLGATQMKWLQNQLSTSESIWKVIGNQVIFSDINYTDVFPERRLNLDAWDGYPTDKRKLIGFFQNAGLENVVFITGDTHCSWAFEVPVSVPKYQIDSTERVAVEFGTPSVTSSNYDEYSTPDTARMAEQLYVGSVNNPHLKFANLVDHGYLLLTLDSTTASAEWWYEQSIKSKESEEYLGRALNVQRGTNEIVLE